MIEKFHLWDINSPSITFFFNDITQTLNLTYHQLEKIQEIAKTKDSILASISHEFRTPLNIIMNNIEQEYDILKLYENRPISQQNSLDPNIEHLLNFNKVNNINSQIILL